MTKKETAGNLAPVEVPADFKKKGLVEVLRGKDYINHKGIVKLLHMHGVMLIKAEPVLELCSVEDMYFTFKCEIMGTRCNVTMCADASPANVNRTIASACSRMAETRAINRAGRTYLGLGQTTFDEMPEAYSPPQRQEARPEPSPSHPSFAKDSPAFFRELGEMAMDYETVKAVTLHRLGLKPSQLEQETRAQLIDYLKTPKGLALYNSMKTEPKED